MNIFRPINKQNSYRVRVDSINKLFSSNLSLDLACFINVAAVMVVVQAQQLNLPLSIPKTSSLLFDPHSLSLALIHSDSSFSLYPSLPSPFSLSSPNLPPTGTLVPLPSSSATFLRLITHNSLTRHLFVVSSPYLAGAAVLLRFWILKRGQTFAKASVLCNQKDLRFDENKLAVVFGVSHGVCVKLAGSINVFAMYSVSNRKVWIFSVKMVGDESVKVMKSAVIDCCFSVFSISVSFGFLILGEDNGVRVFQLRALVKGRVRKNHRRVSKNLNGGVKDEKLDGKRFNGSDDLYFNSAVHSNGEISERSGKMIASNGHLEEKVDKHSDSAKSRYLKLKQDSKEGGVFFVAFKTKEILEGSKSTKGSKKSTKPISIQLLSPNKFLILDSLGDLHLLSLSNFVPGSQIPCHMNQLSLDFKVQMLAVLPDISTKAQTVWVSDGNHTVHTLSISDVDATVAESDKKDDDEKSMQISVTQAIFASEKIQDIIPWSADAILILGQGSIFAYAIS